MTTATRKTIGELSIDNSVLRSEISRLERGTEITFAEHFTKWLGRTIRTSEDLKSFATVRRALLRDYGLLLSSIPGVGYKILTNEQAATDSSRLSRIRKHARMIRKEKATVDLTKLNQLQVQGVVAQLTVAGVIESAAKEKTVVKIASGLNGATTPPALGHALEMLKGKV